MPREERLQLHWAAQTLSAVAHSAIERKPDDGGALVLSDFVLHWRAADGATLASFELEGKTLDAARGWPHRFDIGLLISFDPAADPEEARSIGIGLSPGSF